MHESERKVDAPGRGSRETAVTTAVAAPFSQPPFPALALALESPPTLLSSSVTNRLIVEREKVILIDDDYLCYNSSSMLQKNRV